MKIGIIITGYDRYPMLLTTLNSLSSCNWHDTKFILCDDLSKDERIVSIWNDFYAYEKTKGNECVLSVADEHLGLPGLSKTFRRGLDLCKDCDYVLLIPDDVVFNPYFYEAVLTATKWLDRYSICCMMEDTRGGLFGIDVVLKKNDGYHVTTHADGFGVLMSRKTVDRLDWKINEKEAVETDRSLIWRSISYQARGNIIALDESLMEHVGNLYNATLKKEKSDSKKIYAINLNLFERPEILEG